VIESLATSATHRSFARVGHYLPPGEDPEVVEVSVIVDLAIEAVDGYGQLVADVDTADFRLPFEGERGGRMIVDGYDDLEWRLLDRQSDDGFVVTWKIDRVPEADHKVQEAIDV